MRWEQGRAEIDRMMTDGQLERVPPRREHADVLVAQARAHAASADALRGSDPVGAYSLLYEAARKALTAVLENQGLRPTSRGGHLAVYHAVRAQLDPPLGGALRPFDRMRRHRNDLAYPTTDTPPPDVDSLREDIDKASKIIDVAARVLDDMAPYA